MIKSKLKGQPQIINLIDFYLPVRGNLRRRKSSIVDNPSIDSQDEAKIEREIQDIDKNYDFDVPSAIDWDLLIVRVSFFITIIERNQALKGRETIQ